MKIDLIRKCGRVSASLALIAILIGVAQAQTRNAKKLADATKEAQKASDVFTEIMNVPDKAIPQNLLDKAEAIAVFPGVIKAGFIVGGRGGHGVISRRGRSGWSAPAFFNLGGGSVGLQIGASKTDFVLLFMNEEALAERPTGPAAALPSPPISNLSLSRLSTACSFMNSRM